MPEFQRQSEQAREEANAWVARFAPLVLHSEVLAEPEIRERLSMIRELKRQAPQVRQNLTAYGAHEDGSLKSTFERAATQLNSIEEDLRRRLAKLAPGDPESIPDFDRLNERLDERLARQEIGARTDQPGVLELKTSPANAATAAGLGVFGLGIAAFCAIHAVLFIGGISQVIGPLAFGFLAFYAIFFAAVFAMFTAAYRAASTESILLNGNRLTVRRQFGSWLKEEQHVLASDTPVTIESVAQNPIGGSPMGGRHGRRMRAMITECVVLTDVEGRPVNIGAGATSGLREQIKRKIEAYLAAHN